jgi:hypothetical protein
MKQRFITIAIAVVTLAALLPMVAMHVVATPRSESAPTIVVTDEDVRLFPNPVEGELNMLCEKFDVERLTIFNSTGEVIFNSPMTIAQGNRIIINMNSRPAGYYTVRVWVKGVKQPLTTRIYKK